MKSVFVGNLDSQTAEADLTTLFEPFGQIERIHIATDRETGRARGFAFVDMPNDADAEKAIAALNGKDMGGRNLNSPYGRHKITAKDSGATEILGNYYVAHANHLSVARAAAISDMIVATALRLSLPED